MAVDLHVHTTASDGTFSPEQAVRHAAHLGLKAIAITDHDTVTGIPDALEESKSVAVEVVPGIEMGSDVGGQDIHILGYFIDYQSRWLANYLEQLKLLRLSRAEEMLKKLAERNMPLELNDTLKFASGGILTRAHIARALVQKNYVKNVKEAFSLYLGRDGPCYVVKYNFSATDVLQSLRSVGGIAVLAHPGVSHADPLIPELVEAGLVGLEAICSDHSLAQVKHYRQLARQYGLIVTGGSDDHGPDTPGRFLMGKTHIPDKLLSDLKSAKMRS